LNGRALTRLDDIRFIGQLVLPGLDDISGSFESTIQLGGTLDDPTFDGGFSLSDGLIRYAPIGMKIEDIDIEGQLERRDQGSFKGRFRAGEGIGSIAGNLLYKNMDELQMSVSVSGDQLLVIDTDALKILTNTDLQLGLSQQRVDINGHIMIPSARLTPANLLLESVNDSEDLIIESNVQAGKDEKVPANQFYGQLEVAFGDDVFIKVPGIETHISGSVLFDWSGDQIPLAEGSYELHGKVDVYGPILEIDNGHISFPKVPANNPLLNIKAGREIFGNTQIRSAGVQLIGTLKRPVLEAYTVPVTNEERAWTLLVTGSDFDQAQGVGGFDVGTYIAPRLYVSYGISLFQEDNVISARYDLKKGFGVKVTSGQRETGLDVSYTIDR
jgi:translocation and assembly module TamB